MNRIIPAVIVLSLLASISPGAESPAFPRPPKSTKTFTVYSSALSPFILIRNDGPRTLLFQGLEPYGLAGPSHVAYVADHKVRIAPTSQPIDPSNMTESWMLFFFHSSKGFDQLKNTPYPIDIPIFVVLQKMPSEIKPSGSGLEFTFPSESGHIALMPFFGTSFIRATQTAAWKDTLPQDIFLRCRLLAEVSREYPINVEETFKLFPSQDKVLIRNRFDFLSIDDDWKTGHKKIAPLEYTTALAHRYKFRLLSVAGQVVDLDTPVGPGAWAGVEADECSYTLTGLLRYINTVEQPKQIPPDHPLLADARKNFNWSFTVPSAKPKWPWSVLADAAAVAAYLPHADPATQPNARLGFQQIFSNLFVADSAKEYHSESLRHASNIAIAARDLSLVDSGRWSVLCRIFDSLRADSYWGYSALINDTSFIHDDSGGFDSAFAANVGFARLAFYNGDDASYRVASYIAAKQLLSLWTVTNAYPKWINQKNLWAALAQVDGLQFQDNNGQVSIHEVRQGQPNRPINLEDLVFSDPYPSANIGLAPGAIPGFHGACLAQLRFMKDRMPDHPKYFLDTFARQHSPNFHAAAYLNQSTLPKDSSSLPFQSDLQSLSPHLDAWDLFFDVPVAQRAERRQKFWQNNGGIKGHEFDIVLAGIDQKYVPLWQGSESPKPDVTFRQGMNNAFHHPGESLAFGTSADRTIWPVLQWASPRNPQDFGGVLSLGAVAPDDKPPTANTAVTVSRGFVLKTITAECGDR